MKKQLKFVLYLAATFCESSWPSSTTSNLSKLSTQSNVSNVSNQSNLSNLSSQSSQFGTRNGVENLEDEFLESMDSDVENQNGKGSFINF